MTTARFLQIHTLHSYPAALLNRDETGMAKRMSFGSALRTRISSQCLKRHWRTADDPWNLRHLAGATTALRSRDTVDRRVIAPLRRNPEVSPEVADALVKAFNAGVYGGGENSSRQSLLLGLPEVEFLQEKAAAIAAEHPQDPEAAAAAAAGLFQARGEVGDNFRAFRQNAALPGGIEGALFGRMVTSDPAANIEAAVHVARAFTVHQQESEMDYFSSVDDLHMDEEGPGAAYIGSSELTAGLFYGYVVIDLPELVSNLEGVPAGQWREADRELAAGAAASLTRLIATITPGAKLGATAPYGYAQLLLAEMGDHQPRSLAGAYRNPVEPRISPAVRALAEHLQQHDAAYGRQEARRMVAVNPNSELPGAARLSLPELADWIAAAVRAGETE